MNKPFGGTKRFIAILIIAGLFGGVVGYGIGTLIKHNNFSNLTMLVKSGLMQVITPASIILSIVAIFWFMKTKSFLLQSIEK